MPGDAPSQSLCLSDSTAPACVWWKSGRAVSVTQCLPSVEYVGGRVPNSSRLPDEDLLSSHLLPPVARDSWSVPTKYGAPCLPQPPISFLLPRCYTTPDSTLSSFDNDCIPPLPSGCLRTDPCPEPLGLGAWGSLYQTYRDSVSNSLRSLYKDPRVALHSVPL